MNIPRFALVAAAIIFASAGAARAQEGIYLGLQGGYNDLFGADINDECFFCVSDPEATADVDGGFLAGVVVGYRVDSVMLEAEVTRRDNTIVGVGWSDADRPTDGEVRSHAYMANVITDLYPGQVRPFVGLGIGAATVDLRNWRDANGPLLNGDRTVFAWQVMGGVSAELSPGTRISAEYRLFATEEIGLDFNSGQRAAIAGRSADFEYRQQSVIIGIRQTF